MFKKISFLLLVIGVLLSCSTQRQSIKRNASSAVLTESEEKQFYYHYYEGVRLRDNQEYAAALEAFLFCYEIDSLSAGLNADLGVMYASMGYIPQAQRFFQNCVDLEPTNWWYNVRIINLLMDFGEFQQAIDLAVKLQKIYPYKEDVYYMLASLYTDTHQFDKAINAYDKMEKIVGVNEYLSFEKFRLYLQQKKTKKGIAEIDKLIAEYPAENKYRVLRGDIYMQQNMPEKALEIYQEVLADEPNNAYAHISLSEYYNYTNQPEKAIESVVNAIKSNLLDIDTKLEILGRYMETIMADEKRIDETEELFKLLVEQYPLEEQVHGYYAAFLQYQEREEEMLGELETILYINPRNEGAWYQIIQSHFVKQEFDKVIEITTNALSVLPDNPHLYFYKTLAQSQSDDYEGALNTSLLGLQTVEEKGNKNLKSDYYSQLADIYYNLKEKEKAFEAYEKALDANPSNIYTMNNYAYYLSLEKENLRRAERLSAKTVELEPRNSTFLDTYAWILYQQGNYSLAKFYIERAMDNLKEEYEPGVIYDHYGDILWKNDNAEKAVEMWEKAYESGLNTEEIKLKIETKSLPEEE